MRINRVSKRYRIRSGLLALSLCFCASAVSAQEDGALGQEPAFRRVGAPPLPDFRNLLDTPAGRVLASLKAPLEWLHVSSDYGWRGKKGRRQRFHYGVDYGAPHGTPVYATQDGVVEKMGRKRAFGNYIRLQHDHGVETAYGHLTRFEEGLEVGSELRAGDVIGYVGATGRATGPHLHYEVLLNGVPLDPGFAEKQADDDIVASR